ncbi:glycosyltransferase family 2 protein [Caldinitratiruptor microaerophilus]|uniref:Glycosyl transferase family 2 n=1 Tax=Caldinitratiruptor microaerophilus TaxID=671077 RepID=A0AA35CKV1_9FIRM|nr:glycosyltransferase family 2 protein [Caldinitratiruptor microaerophilus]BDG60283.1 glycosyl transferase family 2 [Caldinitratiruptor microaerophilus]
MRLLLSAASWVITLYVGVGLLGLALSKLRSWLQPATLPAVRRWPAILVLVPAHNEEAVIGPCVASIGHAAHLYPGRVRVIVVADGCIDWTADVARQHGAEVIEIPDGGRGKQVAIARALARVWHDDWDALALVDADNLLDPRFFVEAGRRLAAGAPAVQGYIATANPTASWVSSAYALAYYWAHAIAQAGREALGLSAMLGGTGCLISRATLTRLPWSGRTVSDDLEYTVRMVASRLRVHYEPRALVFDQKPTSLRVSLRQRTRWLRGHLQVYAAYGAHLVRRLPTPAALDLVLYGLYPFAAAVALLQVVALLLSGHAVSAMTGLAIGALFMAPAAPPRYWGRLWLMPLWSLTWLVPFWVALATWRQRAWYHTPHVPQTG